MKVVSKFYFVAVMMMIALAGCVIDSVNEPDEGQDPNNPNNPNVPVGTMKNVALSGIINDANGRPLSGVQVTTGTASATTSADGSFSLDKALVADDRVVVRLEKSGYFSVTRSAMMVGSVSTRSGVMDGTVSTRAGESGDDMFLGGTLCPKGNSDISLQTSFNASDGATLTVGGMRVTIPPAAMISADKKDYNGKVNVNMLYLDPNNPMYASVMPGGDQLATDKSGKKAILMPLGFCKVELTDNAGKRLFVKKGVNARAFYPIPEGADSNLPDAIPVSTFNSRKGIWEEKRMATRVSDTGTRSAAADGSDISTRSGGNGGFDDLAPLTWDDDDLAPLDTKPDGDDLAPLDTESSTVGKYVPVTIIAKGKVVDCKNQPVPGAEVAVHYGENGFKRTLVPSATTYTNAKGEYILIIPEATDFGIHAYANGGSDQIFWDDFPPGQWTAYVPDLKVPCDDEFPRDLAFKYVDYGNNGKPSDPTYITYKDYGMLYREDSWEAPTENQPECKCVDIWNYNTNTYTIGREHEIYFEFPEYLWDDSRTAGPFIDIRQRFDFMRDEKEYVSMLQLEQQKDKITIAGQQCKVYKKNWFGFASIQVAYWRGIMMQMITDGTLDFEVTFVNTNVPSSAFGHTLEMSWMPR